MLLSQQVKLVNALPPIELNAAGGGDCDYVSLENYGHLTIVIQQGVVGAASTATVETHTTNSGAGTAVGFSYRAETTAAGDTLDDLTAVESTGIAMGTTNNTMYIIEIDAATLAEGSPWVRAQLSDPAGDSFGSVLYILSKPRYAGNTMPTAIA